ncbi:MAG: IS200/IS605 family transposase [Bacteroidales bacterium]|nr:IS200/IS605 family transposase [Bacteroidales bacterium]
MAQSLSKVYVHITFSTKYRKALIDNKIKSSLFEYLGGICKGLECNPVKIGGHIDHVHVLCTLSRKIAQMKLLEELKKQSSKWIKTKGRDYADFYWQGGYGIFSVNPSEVDVVINYINNQEEHHNKKTFQDEYRAFLKKYKVEYDERYVWD